MTFIVLQVLGSMSLLSGNQPTSHQSPISSNIRDSKHEKEKEQDLSSHVNLKELKQEQLNHHIDEGKYLFNKR